MPTGSLHPLLRVQHNALTLLPKLYQFIIIIYECQDLLLPAKRSGATVAFDT
jgi:hypothetical protein